MDFIVEPSREIPLVDHVDVLVVGGGPAGMIAAITAARKGSKTALIERYGFLGGMADCPGWTFRWNPSSIWRRQSAWRNTLGNDPEISTTLRL